MEDVFEVKNGLKTLCFLWRQGEKLVLPPVSCVNFKHDNVSQNAEV